MTNARMVWVMLSAPLLASAAVATHAGEAPAPYRAINLEAPAEVIVEPDSRAAVRVISGDPQMIVITSDERRGLSLRCRTRECSYSQPRIIVFTPSVTALSVKGEGFIRVNTGFAPHRTVALSVDGSGQIDSRAIDAQTAVATVKGAGKIRTRASSTLVASATGGGQVIYSGSPQTIVQQGGDVRRADAPAGN